MVLFGRNGFLKVPQFESAVFARRHQDRLDRMESEGSYAVKMTTQYILGIQCLSERFFVHRNLHKEIKSIIPNLYLQVLYL